MIVVLILNFLCVLRIGVYRLIIYGWSSNRTYAILNCILRVSQAISYEVSLSLILLGFFLLCDSYNYLAIFNLVQNISTVTK